MIYELDERIKHVENGISELDLKPEQTIIKSYNLLFNGKLKVEEGTYIEYKSKDFCGFGIIPLEQSSIMCILIPYLTLVKLEVDGKSHTFDINGDMTL